MNVNKNKTNKIQKERRSFLKKSVYSAPAIIALGGLLRPTNASANPVDQSEPPAVG